MEIKEKKATRNLLLIEDDPWTSVVMNIVLRESYIGITHQVKMNGREALEYLDQCDREGHFPDLILVDLNMPVMDGCSFIREFENIFYPNYSACQVIVVSNLRDEMDRVKKMNFGSVRHYCLKPLTTARLNEILTGPPA